MQSVEYLPMFIGVVVAKIVVIIIISVENMQLFHA